MNETAKTLAVAVAILFVLCVGWFFSHYRPNLARVTVLQEKKEELLNKIRGFRISDAELASLEKRVDSHRRGLRAARARFVSKDDLEYAVEQIKLQGARLGLKFDQIIPDYASLMTIASLSEAGAQVQKLTVHLNMRGGYNSFGRFLESLEKLPFLVSLGEVSVVYHKGIHPELELVADAQLFVTSGQASIH